MHPLDHEQILVSITLTHVPTGLQSYVISEIATDTNRTVTEAIDEAQAKAMDDLLNQIENGGGG